jgi:hypothetical protein
MWLYNTAFWSGYFGRPAVVYMLGHIAPYHLKTLFMSNKQQPARTALEIQAQLEAQLNDFQNETTDFLLEQARRSNQATMEAIEQLKALLNPEIEEDTCRTMPAGGDGAVSLIREGEHLLNRLFKAMEAMTTGQAEDKATTHIPLWTGTKTDLVELAYALKATGVISHGQVPSCVIIDRLERAFYVHLDNPPRTFQEILVRKKGYTQFLDQLKNGLLAFIDKNENRYEGKIKKMS